MRIRQEQEKHEHEKALVHARANMIFVIAHQFRTPLTGISMSAQILDRYKSRISPEQYRTHLNRIMGHIDEMDSMIHDMLEARQAFNHGLAFEPAPMSLSEFCKALFDEIAAQYQETHRFQFKDTTSPEYAMLDPSLMKYIVDNLLTNAVKYSPDGGMIAMSVREDGDEFVLTVSDEGIGIPEESYEKIFELFERGTNVEKIQGTGIGLGLVRTCVAQHDGSIEFVSRIGHGTTFTIRLPINRPGKVSKPHEDD
jgi:signal transduction histidine kinase